MPDNAALHHWLDMARERNRVPGPAGADLLGRTRRSSPPRTCLQRHGGKGELKAPVVIGRESSRLRLRRLPNRETESMRDGSDAVSDRPMLNALLNCASGATWVSLHHGGGVGMGFSQHAGMVIVCDARLRPVHGSVAYYGTTRRPA